MPYDPDDARDIVWAILALHNLLRSDTIGRTLYSPPALVDREDIVAGCIERGQWRQEPAPRGCVTLGRPGGNRHANDALALRDKWCDYFSTVGAVPWQERMTTVPV